MSNDVQFSLEQGPRISVDNTVADPTTQKVRIVLDASMVATGFAGNLYLTDVECDLLIDAIRDKQ